MMSIPSTVFSPHELCVCGLASMQMIMTKANVLRSMGRCMVLTLQLLGANWYGKVSLILMAGSAFLL